MTVAVMRADLFTKRNKKRRNSFHFISSFLVNCDSEEDTIDEGSVMKLWTVNGRFIGLVTCEHMINCLEFSSAPEGMSVNVIATGLSNGAIR